MIASIYTPRNQREKLAEVSAYPRVVSQAQSHAFDRRTWRALGTVSRGGGAMLSPVKWNTTPSRSIRQTIASSALECACGGDSECRCPFVPTLNRPVEHPVAPSGLLMSPKGNFAQPSRCAAGKSMPIEYWQASCQPELQTFRGVTYCACPALGTTPPNMGVPMLHLPSSLRSTKNPDGEGDASGDWPNREPRESAAMAAAPAQSGRIAREFRVSA